MIPADPSVGFTRKDIVNYAREHEPHIKRRVLEKVKGFLSEPIPEDAYLKCEHAGEVYGDFKLHQDWQKEMYDEFADMFFYQALEECSQMEA